MSQAGILSLKDAPLPPSVPTVFQTDDGAQVVPLLNKLIVAGGTGATTTGNVGTGTVTVNIQTDSFKWSNQSVGFNAFPQNGYFCTGALISSLPATRIDLSPLQTGDTIIFYVDTASNVVIQCNGTQQLNISNNQSSAGGKATSNSEGSTLTLVYRVEDLNWHAVSSLGSWSTA